MERILECVRLLAAPYGEANPGAKSGEVKIADSSQWMQVCEIVWEKVPPKAGADLLIRAPESSSAWKLVCTILDILIKLKEEMEKIEKTQGEEEIKVELLSVQSQACVSTCIELIIRFGVLPYVLPGIVIPNKFRKINAQIEFALKDELCLPEDIQFHHLAHVLQGLMTLSVHPKFANIVMYTHLTEVFLGLMQTIKCPIKKPEVGTTNSFVGGTINALNMDEYKRVMTTRRKLDFQYQISFLNIIPKAMLVHSLFIGGRQQSQWMAQSCRDLLHEILLGKSGLLTICQALSEMTDSATNFEVGKVVNNLIFSACTTGDASKTTERLSNLCTQCYEVILYSHEEKENRKGTVKTGTGQSCLHISLWCGTAMTNINNSLAHRMLWTPLFGGMNRIISDNEYARAFQIEQCADLAQILLRLTPPEEIELPIYLFKETWYIFLHILVACEKYINRNQLRLSQRHITVSIRAKLIHVFTSLLEILSKSKERSTSSSWFCRDLILSLINYNYKTVVVQDSSSYNSKLTSPTSSTVDLRFACAQSRPEDSHEMLSQGCSIFTKTVLPEERLKEIRSLMFSQLNGSGGEEETQSENSKLVVRMLLDNIAAEDKNRYEKALRELKDSQLAVKERGLLKLQKLIEENDKETMENDQFLLNLFKDELKQDDMSIYLMAMSGMAALGSRFHDVVMPTLMGLYDFQEGNSDVTNSKLLISMSAEERAEFRLKIGEMLVKVIQKLGTDTASVYRVSVSNVYIRTMRDEDEAVRSSALSNLGELCELLKLALDNTFKEVWQSVENLLESEKSCEVRQAALHLTVLLLYCVEGKLPFEFLAVSKDFGVFIRDAENWLTKLRCTESDPACLSHIELALAKIASMASNFPILPKDSI